MINIVWAWCSLGRDDNGEEIRLLQFFFRGFLKSYRFILGDGGKKTCSNSKAASPETKIYTHARTASASWDASCFCSTKTWPAGGAHAYQNDTTFIKGKQTWEWRDVKSQGWFFGFKHIMHIHGWMTYSKGTSEGGDWVKVMEVYVKLNIMLCIIACFLGASFQLFAMLSLYMSSVQHNTVHATYTCQIV